MDENQDLLNEMVMECMDQLDGISDDVLNLEEINDQEIINKIFRAFHSIKGNINMLGFSKCGEFSHEIEDVVSLIRDRQLKPDKTVVDVLLNCLDELKEFLEYIRENGSDARDVSALSSLLASLTTEKHSTDTSTSSQDNKADIDVQYKGYRFLIVEDDFTSRFLLQKMLSPFGDVYTAVNGREAIKAFDDSITSQEPYNLICLDIMMPEKDGLTVLKEIREKEELNGILPGRGVKIVMTTTLTGPQDVMKSFDGMCNGYIFKPINKDKLFKLLKEFGLWKPDKGIKYKT